jgi:hypothetical protein
VVVIAVDLRNDDDRAAAALSSIDLACFILSRLFLFSQMFWILYPKL